MSAAAVIARGIVEVDPLIARAEVKLIKRADRLIILADSTKFTPKGNLLVCPLSRVSILITDDGVSPEAVALLEEQGVTVRIAPFEKSIAAAA